MEPFVSGLPKFAVVGEAPGEAEDEQGIPFIGQSGTLLWDELGRHSIKRQDAFVTNIVKCRPPNNRDPKVKEINACRPYLEAEFEWLREIGCKTVLVLGAKAYKALGGTGNITQAQGVSYEYEGFTVFPCIHPSAALRSQRSMEDFQHTISRFVRLLNGEEETGPPDCEAVLVNG